MAENLRQVRPYATVDDVTDLWRALSYDEMQRAGKYIEIVSAELRQRADAAGKALDVLAQDADYAEVLKSVVCDIVARVLMTNADHEPMTQMSESAGGYSVSGTFLVPGGGLFIKRSELSRLGLRRQKWGGLNVYD